MIVINVVSCHDLHFLVYSGMFMGNFETAISAANRLKQELTEEVIIKYGDLVRLSSIKMGNPLANGGRY